MDTADICFAGRAGSARKRRVAAAAMIAFIATGSLAEASNAQSASGEGSFAFVSARRCQSGLTGPCNLGGFIDPQPALVGGPGTANAGTQLTVPSGSAAGSTGTSSVAFDGTSNLPSLHVLSSSSGDGRINASAFGYKVYTYSGASWAMFSLSGTLHMDASTLSPDIGNADDRQAPPGFATLYGYVQIWSMAGFLSQFGASPTLNSLFAGSGYNGCGLAGVLGSGSVGLLGNGGSGQVSVATAACNASSLQLQPGETVVVAAQLGAVTNRGGLVDATHSFTVDYDPALGSDAIATLASNLKPADLPAVPEPATWASMLMGFGAAGATLRVRARRLARTRKSNFGKKTGSNTRQSPHQPFSGFTRLETC